MRKSSIIKIIIILFLVTIIISLKSAFHYLSGYLSVSQHVKANILVVEGWLPDSALKLAAMEFRNNGYERIVATGLKTVNEYRRIAANGFVIIYPDKKLTISDKKLIHTFAINCYSELGGDNRAHFNFYLNDSLVANFLSEQTKKIYNVKWEGNLNRIDSIMIEFDNDKWGETGDRNLLFKEIVIDQKITFPSISNPSYFVTDKYSRMVFNNFYSYGQMAKDKLILSGIDSSAILAVSGERVRINRTLTSALAFRDWTRKTNINITGINIISMGAHARRTWMIYNKILNEKYSIGIISLPDKHYNKSRRYKIFKTIRESLGIIYYWFILLPY